MEFVDAFTAFVVEAKRDGIEHIFIGGDTFHTKTAGMSPECIDLMCWLFTELAGAAEVHITLGNHDFNMVNTSRQDAISPIVKALANPRIHLYKNSGMYEFAPGFVWCIFSLADEENWKNVKPVPGKVSIACYHGPVWGAQTETGWLIEDGLTIDAFKDYDFTFLGDIHKTQYLAFRDVELTIDEGDLYHYPGAEVLDRLSE